VVEGLPGASLLYALYLDTMLCGSSVQFVLHLLKGGGGWLLLLT
jgi:hypothetical protein